MKNIQLLVLDVDGTMTDGGVYYDDHGNETKKFAIKDGAALVLAHAAGLQVMICTGRECPAVARRAADCGDDLNDLAAMSLCGFVSCPADACSEVRQRADYICPQKGGEGAVRGMVEKILRSSGRWQQAVQKAFGADV